MGFGAATFRTRLKRTLELWDARQATSMLLPPTSSKDDAVQTVKDSAVVVAAVQRTERKNKDMDAPPAVVNMEAQRTERKNKDMDAPPAVVIDKVVVAPTAVVNMEVQTNVFTSCGSWHEMEEGAVVGDELVRFEDEEEAENLFGIVRVPDFVEFLL